MKLTPAQKRLLVAIEHNEEDSGEPMWVGRSEQRTAKALVAKGIVRTWKNEHGETLVERVALAERQA